MPTIKTVSREEGDAQKKRRPGKTLDDFSTNLRESLQRLGPEQSLQLELEPGDKLSRLRQAVSSNAKAVGIAVSISTMREDRGLIVEKKGRPAKPVVANASPATTGLEATTRFPAWRPPQGTRLDQSGLPPEH